MKLKTKNAKCKTGFTLVELLVVIAIIGILAALLLPALSAGKERAIRAKCLSNVHQISLASLSYGTDNRDRLPTSVPTGPLPIMLTSVAASEFVSRYCPSRDVFYDPANPALNQDANWNYGVIYNAGVQERFIGYVVTFRGVAWLKSENVNTFSVAQPVQVGSVMLPAPVSSERVLISGVVLSEAGQDKTNDAIRATYNYGEVPLLGVNDGDDLLPYSKLRTSHLRNKYPTGENLGMLDGSARWRKFEPMIPRTTNGVTTFWW